MVTSSIQFGLLVDVVLLSDVVVWMFRCFFLLSRVVVPVNCVTVVTECDPFPPIKKNMYKLM